MFQRRHNDDVCSCMNTAHVKMKKYEMKYIDAEIVRNNQTQNVKVKALIDSGTEIPVINNKCIAGFDRPLINMLDVHVSMDWRYYEIGIFVCKIMAE